MHRSILVASCTFYFPFCAFVEDRKIEKTRFVTVPPRPCRNPPRNLAPEPLEHRTKKHAVSVPRSARAKRIRRDRLSLSNMCERPVPNKIQEYPYPPLHLVCTMDSCSRPSHFAPQYFHEQKPMHHARARQTFHLPTPGCSNTSDFGCSNTFDWSDTRKSRKDVFGRVREERLAYSCLSPRPPPPALPCRRGISTCSVLCALCSCALCSVLCALCSVLCDDCNG